MQPKADMVPKECGFNQSETASCAWRFQAHPQAKFVFVKGSNMCTPTNPFTSIDDWQDHAHYIDSYTPARVFFFQGTHKVRDELQLSHFAG